MSSHLAAFKLCHSMSDESMSIIIKILKDFIWVGLKKSAQESIPVFKHWLKHCARSNFSPKSNMGIVRFSETTF